MDVKQFWAIIDCARSKSEDWEEMIPPLVNELSKLDVSDIMLWAQIFSEYQRLSYKEKLWAAAYVINGGCSDDGFDYFRAWLTAQGQAVFEMALKDPDSLAEVEACEEDVEFEDMLSVACDAYFKKLQIKDRSYDRYYAELDKYPLPAEIKSEMIAGIEYAADIDANWDDDDEESLAKLVPKLCEAFDF